MKWVFIRLASSKRRFYYMRAKIWTISFLFIIFILLNSSEFSEFLVPAGSVFASGGQIFISDSGSGSRCAESSAKSGVFRPSGPRRRFLSDKLKVFWLQTSLWSFQCRIDWPGFCFPDVSTFLLPPLAKSSRCERRFSEC